MSDLEILEVLKLALDHETLTQMRSGQKINLTINDVRKIVQMHEIRKIHAKNHRSQ